MKIAYRLILLSAFSAIGLLCVATVSYVAVTTIQSDLRGLTLEATPLQNKTYEQQERTERVLGGLMMRLTLAATPEDADKLSAPIQAEMQGIQHLNTEMNPLSGRAGQDFGPFIEAQQEITRSVRKRLADNSAYRAEAQKTHQALQAAAEALTVTRAGVSQISVDAGQAADRAQDAMRRLSAQVKQALTAQTRLKEIALVVYETDAVGSRFKLIPLKEKVKASIDSLLRIEAGSAGDDVLKDTKALFGGMYDGFAKDGSGLLAQRANVLAAKPDADAAYQKQRRAILGPIEEQAARLGTLIDSLEVQSFKQREQLAAALRLRNEPGDVVATSEQASLDIREMIASLRLLMLAGTEKERADAHAALKTVAERLGTNLGAMKASLAKMGRAQLVPPVEAATASLAEVGRSIDTMADAKRQLLESEQSMQQALARLKTVAAAQAKAGAEQVRDIAERQREVTAAVDQRVHSSLVGILSISASIIVASALLSWRIVRSVRQRLDRAVSVARAVSDGRLQDVAPEHDSDEAAQVLQALRSMVGTLRVAVSAIHHSAHEIDGGSGEINRGSADLTQRTERQSGNLQTTTAAVEQLSSTLQANTESARKAASWPTRPARWPRAAAKRCRRRCVRWPRSRPHRALLSISSA